VILNALEMVGGGMSGVRARSLFVVFIASWAAGLVTIACSSPSASKAATASAPPAHADALWGDMKPVVSVKELMRDMLDPASDYIFDAVKIVTTKNGTVETVPKTEEDWAKLRVGATTIAEGVYLLKVPRPFTPPGDNNNSAGPDATELSPAQIKEKLEKDPVLWNAKIEALRNVAKEVLDIVDKKNTAELWEASYNLDQACESCHLQYWYPGDPALLQKVDRQLDELYNKSNTAAKTQKPK
jgi:cytochrome c556